MYCESAPWPCAVVAADCSDGPRPGRSHDPGGADGSRRWRSATVETWIRSWSCSRAGSTASDAHGTAIVAMPCGAIIAASLSRLAPDWLGAFPPPADPSLAAHELGLREPALLDDGVDFVAPSVAAHFVVLDGRCEVGGTEGILDQPD